MLWSGLTHTGLEPTIYRTRGERASQYTTHAVDKEREYNIKESVVDRDQPAKADMF